MAYRMRVTIGDLWRAPSEKWGTVRVNVGCGSTPTSGWINLDNSPSVRLARWPILVRMLSRVHFLDDRSSKFASIARQENIRYADASRRIPLADNSAEVVYSSHMIEHLDRREAKAFLLEVNRILRPGGMVRLAAPDLGLLLKSYVDSGDADDFIARSHTCRERPRGVLPRVKVALSGPRHHLWMYDGRSLVRMLCDAGFVDARVMSAGTTDIPDPGSLDLAERAAESVYVEAIRPTQDDLPRRSPEDVPEFVA
jgi:predicted SAM-dependent methyltransferase